MSKRKSISNIIYIRCIFRVITLLLLLLMLMFIFGEGLPDFSNFSFREVILFLCFLGMATGLVYVWFNERIGSFILLISSILFWLINLLLTGNPWLGWFLLVYPIIGFIFFILSRKSIK